ncbi:Sh3 and multiple ankyrin repeat domains protein 1 isoform x4 [Gryllus bimaculatus]|nr:Sh3 and multiple ankyrin repeat domains protein 1 isoform x4 [Gryllus bimaculatus]
MAQILDRMKPDRMTASKPEEDRRRRTIIVEKKNGSFGFTLQSYGIHYKKEQEIEMITYVDYVDYDGAAFRAGDVILSINGHDMEKADHKTLVNFIKNCDSRMRMVVLFEDCVRKVELHMRYIQLQRVLQGKMVELERLCLRERELLQGKWKTHSLPARKKTSAVTPHSSTPLEDNCEYGYCRPTVSTEDVARVQQSRQSQVMFAYQYLEPGYYSLQKPPDSNNGKFMKSWSGQDIPAHTPHRAQNCEEVASHSTKLCDASNRQNTTKGYHQTNGMAAASSGFKCSKTRNQHQESGQSHSTSNSLCSPCVQTSQDSSSLEAYDLASPCCDPHCVPSARRRSRHSKEARNVHGNRSSKNGSETRGWKENGVRSGQNVSSQTDNCQMAAHPAQPPHPRVHRYFNFGAGLVSQCSLHSCTSSELSCTAPGGAGCESSAASYSTSLSTDTLYWDPSTERGEYRNPLHD